MTASAPTRSTTPSHDFRHDERRASPGAAARVAVLLHDSLLARAVTATLRDQGVDTVIAAPPATPDALAGWMTASCPDLVVIDIDTPPSPIDAAIEMIRCAAGHLAPSAVIGVAPAAADALRTRALLAGADDAVSTPITATELAAHCRAVLRRTRPLPRATDPVAAALLTFGPVTVDVGRKEIRVLGREVPATRIEFALFEQLCRHPAEVRERTTLLTDVWGPHWVGDTHVVDVHLSNLRRKLQRIAPGLNVIHTVRGIGFRLGDDLTRPTHLDERRSA